MRRRVSIRTLARPLRVWTVHPLAEPPRDVATRIPHVGQFAPHRGGHLDEIVRCLLRARVMRHPDSRRREDHRFGWHLVHSRRRRPTLPVGTRPDGRFGEPHAPLRCGGRRTYAFPGDSHRAAGPRALSERALPLAGPPAPERDPLTRFRDLPGPGAAPSGANQPGRFGNLSVTCPSRTRVVR